MLKKARLLTRPTLARRDAPYPMQGRSSEADPRFTFHASRFTVLGSDARTPLAALFSILLDDFPEVFDRAKEGILELYLRLPFQESTCPTDIGPSDFGIIGGQRMMGDLAR